MIFLGASPDVAGAAVIAVVAGAAVIAVVAGAGTLEAALTGSSIG